MHDNRARVVAVRAAVVALIITTAVATLLVLVILGLRSLERSTGAGRTHHSDRTAVELYTAGYPGQ